jgi:hypothetical protein
MICVLGGIRTDAVFPTAAILPFSISRTPSRIGRSAGLA